MNMYIWLVLALVIGYVIYVYNGLVKLKTLVEEAWSDIDVQLKRRYDLIPNLVATVKGFATHEEKVLTAVTEARNMAMNAKTVEEHAAAENQLSGALKTLFAVSENYPALTSAPNFLSLQQELTATEEKIQGSRRFYNANVRELNMRIDTFPTNIIANTFSFAKRPFFELANESERENAKVQF